MLANPGLNDLNPVGVLFSRGKDGVVFALTPAVKWQRILWRCWQNRTPYNEATYLKSLQRRGLKIYAALWPENTPPMVNKK